MEFYPTVKSFDPSKQYGSSFYCWNEALIPSYRADIEEFLDDFIPEEYRHLVTWHARPGDPESDDVWMQDWKVSWKYTPPQR